MTRRAEIDGLRAVAVSAVILFHAGVRGFEAGYLGVDVFFVISGFLIGQIILRELSEGRFRFSHFYLRRTRRILPALTVMLLACALAGWVLLPPTGFKNLAEGLGTTVLFLSNFYYMTQTGYFGPQAETLALLHTWSLAIEEQYYLLFPILAVLIFRFARATFFPLITLLCIASFVLGLSLQAGFPEKVYFFTPARVWQILLGVLAILGRDRLPSRAADLGFVLIILGFIVDRGATSFPTPGAVLVCLGAAIYLPSASSQQGAGRLLSLEPLRLIGLVSYSAYLWHQPLFAFSREITQTHLTGLQILALIGLTFLVATLSYRFIELPFQNPARRLSAPRVVWPLALLTTAALFGFAFQGHKNGGYPERFSPEVQRLSLLEQQKLPYRNSCGYRGVGANPEHPLVACLFEPETAAKGEVILIGDSHTSVISKPLIKRLTAEGYSVYLTFSGGCTPALGLKVQFKDHCESFMQAAYAYAAQRPEATVVLASRFALYIQSREFDNLETSEGLLDVKPTELVEQTVFRAPQDASRVSDVAERIAQSLSALARTHNVLVVAPIPEAGIEVPKWLIKKLISGGEIPSLSTPFHAYQARHQPFFDALLASGFDAGNVFQTADVFCEGAPRRCALTKGQTALYNDNNHLSETGVEMLAEALMAFLRPRLN